MRQTARARKQERFTALLHHLTIDLLRESYYALKRRAAPGVDGVSWQQYEQGLEERLSDLHGRVIVERIGHNLREESIYRKPTAGNDRWASRHWKTRSSSTQSRPSSTRFTRWTFEASRTGFDRAAVHIRRWTRSMWASNESE